MIAHGLFSSPIPLSPVMQLSLYVSVIAALGMECAFSCVRFLSDAVCVRKCGCCSWPLSLRCMIAEASPTGSPVENFVRS